MNVQLIASAAKDFEELSPRLTTLKQLEFLRQDLHHPSIRAKKYDQGCVARTRETETIAFIIALSVPPTVILRIIPHPK